MQRKSKHSIWLTVALGITAVAAVTFGSAPAVAAPARKCSERSVKKLKLLNRDALDELDRWNTSKARRKLSDARLIAKSRGCLGAPALAVSYAILGVVEQRERRTKQMKAAWTKALRIHWKVQIPKRVVSAKVMRMFAWVKRNTTPAARPTPPPPRRTAGGKGDPRTPPRRRVAPPPRPRRPAGPPKAFTHLNPRKWYKGKRLVLTVRAPTSMRVAAVKLYYRPRGEKRFKVKSFTMVKADRWGWQASIPGVYLYIAELQYYIVAYAAGNRPVTANGNSFQTNKIKLIR